VYCVKVIIQNLTADIVKYLPLLVYCMGSSVSPASPSPYSLLQRAVESFLRSQHLSCSTICHGRL